VTRHSRMLSGTLLGSGMHAEVTRRFGLQGICPWYPNRPKTVSKRVLSIVDSSEALEYLGGNLQVCIDKIQLNGHVVHALRRRVA
jgi:hypothetical protein